MNFSLNQTLLTPSGAVVQTITATGEASSEMDVSVPIATNTQVNLTAPYASIKCIEWLSDVALTVKTNSTSVPDQTITLAANVPMIWINGGSGTNPITADITKIYVTAATAGTFKSRILFDPTPSV